MPDILEERLLGEHILMLANDGDVNYQNLVAEATLYEAPLDKRAIIKDVRITPAIIDPNSLVDVVWPTTNVTKNEFQVTVGQWKLFISNASSPDEYPRALYLGNLSGSVLPAIVLEPGERLLLHWKWQTSDNKTFEVFIQARISGVEVEV